jgi:phage regulator Rha-like protein
MEEFMINELVKLVEGEPMVSTLDMWQSLKVEHKALVELVQKYEDRFASMTSSAFEKLLRKSGSHGGRPTPYYLLNEMQTTFLITLMRNSEVVVPFKEKLTKEFFRMRKMLLKLATQKDNAEWLEARKNGKTQRKIETDIIKEFVEYSIAQGSENAQRYYTSISKMENKALFLVIGKFKNLREVLDFRQLSLIAVADTITTKVLRDGMAAEADYHDIYQLAKARIEELAEIYGKTNVPGFELTIS